MPSRYLTVLFTFLLVLVRSFTASAAEAAKGGDAADPVAKIQQLNREAMQYFDDLNYAMSEKSLLEALSLVEKANLGSGPAGLSTHGNLAVLYSAGFKKPDKAVFHFKKALAIKPDLKLSKQRSTPETEANLARAKAEMAGVAVGPSPNAAYGEALSCPTEGEIHAGDDITFKCTTSASIKVGSVTLHYKPNDGEEYQVVQMSKEGTSAGATSWVAKVPGTHTQGTMVPFYVEAHDPSGEMLALSGREDNPSVIVVKGAGIAAGPPPVQTTEEEEEEEDDEEFDDDNPLAQLERERWREHEGSKGSWLISMGVGSGLGYASGKSTEAFGKKYGVGFNPGVAPASLGQVVWEVAYFVGRQTALSIGGRHQGIFGGVKGTATGAHSVLMRSLFFTPDEGKVRWYFALAAGGGEGFRLSVEATVKHPDTGDPIGNVKDTVRGGPFVAGMGGGMLYKLGRRWHLSIDAQALLGIPNTSAVVDLTAGLRWQY